jgi:hypothetical protein
MNLSGTARGSRRENRVRAMRAYLAGLGTAGSLVAGAALLFVLASAFVAFRGSPDVAAPPAPVSVAVALPAARVLPSVERRRPVALAVRALSARVGKRRARRAAAATGSVPAVAGGAAARGGSGRGSVSAPAPAAAHPPVARSSAQGVPSGGCAGRCGVPVLSSAVSQATNTSGKHVSALASTVTGVTSAAAGALRGTSPAAAQAVTSASGIAGGALSSAGSALPGH